MDVSSDPRATAHNRLRRLQILVVFMLWLSVIPASVHAVTGLTFTVITPYAVLDANNCATQGPRAMYIQVNVTNNSGGTLNNLTATFDGFSAAGFTLDAGEAPTRYIGTLANGATFPLYYYINYPPNAPCTAVLTTNYTITVSDGVTAPQTSGTLVLNTHSELSANAGGQVVSSTIGPGAIVGQIIPMTVNYSFGNPAAGATAMIQPAGNISFDGGCFRLLSVDITASTFTAGPTTTNDDRLFFTAVNGPSSNTATVVYYFQMMCSGVSTTANPFSDLTSGGPEKYTGNFGTCSSTGAVCPSYPTVTNPFTISKSASPTSLPAGGAVTYTIVINNPSAFATTLDRIDDALPAGVTFTAIAGGSGVTVGNSSSTPAPGAAGTIAFIGRPTTTCVGGCNGTYAIPAGGSLTLIYTANVPATPNAYTNSATATIGSTTIGPATATVSTGSADVVTTKTGPASASAGGTIVYNVTTTNNGPTAATGVVIQDALPAGVAFVSATNGGLEAGGVVTWPMIASLANGASVTYQVTVTAPASGPLLNVASSTATTNDPTPANNDGSQPGARVTTAITFPILDASKIDAVVNDVAPVGPSPGDTLQYTISIPNTGTAPATGATFSDSIPANTTYVAGSTTLNGLPVADVGGAMPFVGGQAINTPGEPSGTLNNGETATIVFRVMIDNPVPPGVTQISNQGALSASGIGPILTDDPTVGGGSDPTVTPITAAPLLSASKDVTLANDVAPVGPSPGDTLQYTISVPNTGNVAATGAAFNDSIPANTTYVAGSTTLNGVAVADVGGAMPFVGGRAINSPGAPSGQVNAGATATIVFRVTVANPLPPGVIQVSNQGTVSATGLPSVPTDDPTTPASGDPTVTPVTAAPALNASKTDLVLVDVAPVGPSPGDTLQYLITISNNGNGAASGVQFSDTPDPNTTLVVGSVTTSAGTITGGNAGVPPVTVDIGTLPGGGASVTIGYQATIANPLPPGVIQVSNQGTLSATGLPSVPTDDPTTPTGGDPTVTPVVAGPILTADKDVTLLTDADGNGTFSPGDELLYRITIINSGNGAATGVSLDDTPDINTTLEMGTVQTSQGIVTAGNGGIPPITVSLGTLPGGGASAVITFRVTINNPLPGGVTQVANQGVVGSTQLPPVSTNDPGTSQRGDPTVSPITIPTAIVLVSFTATRGGNVVNLRWTTSFEYNTWGFRLYRSIDGRRANAMSITPQIILAQARGQGATYDWTDSSTALGSTYSYWLQEIELSSATNEYGPIAVAAEPAAAAHTIFIPLVTR